MHNEENKNIRTPRRGPGMRGPGMGGAVEKPKDFKSAIKRLMKELKNFKGVIVFALILAMISAILSIYAPSKLSDLTDKISEGLVVNQDNVKELSEKITSNLSEENLTLFLERGWITEDIKEKCLEFKTIFYSLEVKHPELWNIDSVKNSVHWRKFFNKAKEIKSMLYW